MSIAVANLKRLHPDDDKAGLRLLSPILRSKKKFPYSGDNVATQNKPKISGTPGEFIDLDDSDDDSKPSNASPALPGSQQAFLWLSKKRDQAQPDSPTTATISGSQNISRTGKKLRLLKSTLEKGLRAKRLEGLKKRYELWKMEQENFDDEHKDENVEESEDGSDTESEDDEDAGARKTSAVEEQISRETESASEAQITGEKVEVSIENEDHTSNPLPQAGSEEISLGLIHSEQSLADLSREITFKLVDGSGVLGSEAESSNSDENLASALPVRDYVVKESTVQQPSKHTIIKKDILKFDPFVDEETRSGLGDDAPAHRESCGGDVSSRQSETEVITDSNHDSNTTSFILPPNQLREDIKNDGLTRDSKVSYGTRDNSQDLFSDSFLSNDGDRSPAIKPTFHLSPMTTPALHTEQENVNDVSRLSSTTGCTEPCSLLNDLNMARKHIVFDNSNLDSQSLESLCSGPFVNVNHSPASSDRLCTAPTGGVALVEPFLACYNGIALRLERLATPLLIGIFDVLGMRLLCPYTLDCQNAILSFDEESEVQDTGFKKRRPTRLFVSDDEDNEDDTAGLTNSVHESALSMEANKQSEIGEDSNGSELPVEEDVSENEEYERSSDDETSVVANIQKNARTFTDDAGKIKNEFFELEAELSGSDDEGEEDEEPDSEDDQLEEEEGDDDNLPSDDELRHQVGMIHFKQMLDEDKRVLRRYKEAYLMDGELFDESAPRRFRWKKTGDDLFISSSSFGYRPLPEADPKGAQEDADLELNTTVEEEVPDGDDLALEEWSRSQRDRASWLYSRDSQNADVSMVEEESEVIQWGSLTVNSIETFDLTESNSQAPEKTKRKVEEEEQDIFSHKKMGKARRESLLFRSQTTLEKVYKCSGDSNSGFADLSRGLYHPVSPQKASAASNQGGSKQVSVFIV
ncbi:unnamed protein product [Soboliphyme baturini]|uniref:Claspin n=1 Tax=Soboliphyme baturini TaxID=241478 RepID=A0A183IGI8_9BILA|nr:unnamed protein product [Soboliphyme baturini]